MSSTAPTWAEFIAAYPAFSGTAYATSGPLALSLSTRLMSPQAWESFYSDAVMLDCAHSLAILGPASSSATGGIQAATGPISSVSVAGTSTSFNAPSSDGKSRTRDWYMKTAFGQQLLSLMDRVIVPGFQSPEPQILPEIERS